MDKIQEILTAVRKGNERHKQLEVYMESCGMELWHSHFLKHRCSFYMARVSPVQLLLGRLIAEDFLMSV